MNIVPADYPPRFRASDYVVRPSAGEDERIDVGVLFARLSQRSKAVSKGGERAGHESWANARDSMAAAAVR